MCPTYLIGDKRRATLDATVQHGRRITQGRFGGKVAGILTILANRVRNKPMRQVYKNICKYYKNLALRSILGFRDA